ncbi:MAG TPA: DUF6191 domain-containing protein [Streptomyces sp.]|nr:DUF6191 domain-containing protein [Streptomyces sp.]HWU09883.1 DUF6191 domain-containing protein [Streptomyces sp.]
MFNFFEELFAPGRKHTAEEQKRLELSRVDLGTGDPARGPIDLTSGKVTLLRPPPGPGRPDEGPGPEDDQQDRPRPEDSRAEDSRPEDSRAEGHQPDGVRARPHAGPAGDREERPPRT